MFLVVEAARERLKMPAGESNPNPHFKESHKRLPVFISENIGPIVGEWEDFARTLKPSAHMTSLALRDHIHQILAFIVEDIKSDQTPKEETIKSRGLKTRSHAPTAAETHAALRLTGGFDIGQMTSEYRALRASVIKLWRRNSTLLDEEDFNDITRFNESIDQALTESVIYYIEEVVFSKDLFAGILGHDLRSPLQAIVLSAELMLLGALTERQRMLTQNISESSKRMNELIGDLLDVTRARFGAGFSIRRVPMDMGFVGNQIVDEIRIGHPSRTIGLVVSEDVKGEWDKARVGQVFSNLIGNAIQYGFRGTPIDVAIEGDIKAVTLTVHNNGTPIAQDKIVTIFNPLTRARPDGNNELGSRNLGLGLFIAREVVQAHGGTIQVSSSEEKGTTFTARFPRSPAAPILYVA